MMAIFQALEIGPHVLGTPRRIAGELSDVVPVGVVWINQDHGMVSRAATERAGPRIEDTIMGWYELTVPSLLRFIRIVPDEEIPLHRLVLGRKRVECRH